MGGLKRALLIAAAKDSWACLFLNVLLHFFLHSFHFLLKASVYSYIIHKAKAMHFTIYLMQKKIQIICKTYS